MSIYRPRETKRARMKLSKNVARIYRQSKCRDCSVVVIPMDFAKILGKFTKVKIQYESSSPKGKQGTKQVATPNSNARLKSNENGMVLIHRTAYNKHPVNNLSSSKKQKPIKVVVNNSSPQKPSNILKENNILKKTPERKVSNIKKKILPEHIKHYGLVFDEPKLTKDEIKNTVSLSELLPVIDKTILPSDEWAIDYFPNNCEPKEDKVYDRIAAELEDLMYNDNTTTKVVVKQQPATKVDDFPSIMDILNDNPSESTNGRSIEQSTPVSSEFKTNLESSDVEAMLMGEPSVNKTLDSISMDVDPTVVNKLIADVDHLSDKNTEKVSEKPAVQSSILDEAIQKTIADQLPQSSDSVADDSEGSKTDNVVPMETEEKTKETNIQDSAKYAQTTHIVFKQMKDGNCYRSVMCPKSLKYAIELEGKSVELLGAPKFVSSLEDLQVLLQIVNESGLSSVYVLH